MKNKWDEPLCYTEGGTGRAFASFQSVGICPQHPVGGISKLEFVHPLLDVAALVNLVVANPWIQFLHCITTHK